MIAMMILPSIWSLLKLPLALFLPASGNRLPPSPITRSVISISQIILIHIEKNLTCSKDKVGSGVGLLVVKGVVLLPAALLNVG